MIQDYKKEGKIITFYSFKGGVGRSMALANIAIMLADWGHKVLIIDWDLEAPGLENFFSEHISLERARTKAGLIDLLDYQINKTGSGKEIQWKDCLVPVLAGKFKSTAKLDLITAGNIDDGYYEKVRSFDFNSFYADHNGGEVIENLRREWIAAYDFVLIDSRTGVTDIGGICTVQLPDILVIIFTPTNQSLAGVKRVALKAMKAQRKLPYERINLLTLPVPARMDNSEYKLSQEWIRTFEDELKEVYAPWFPGADKIVLNEFLLNTKIPYISYFSFGEKLPVLEEGVSNPTSMGFSYHSIAALLATRLNYPELLVNNRVALLNLAQENTNEIPSDTYRGNFIRNSLSGPSIIFDRMKKILHYNIKLSSALIVLAVFVLFSIYSLKIYQDQLNLISEKEKQAETLRLQLIIQENTNLKKINAMKDSLVLLYEDKFNEYKAVPLKTPRMKK
jgi:cellulose biosynthesis protein BcsQ